MLILGNGESRKNVNLNNVNCIKIGCNAIFRDYKVDHIVCVDKRMMDEALKLGVNIHSRLYTRSNWYDRYKGYLHVRQVPELPYEGTERADQPFQWGSGPYAVLLGAQLGKDEVKLLGFDLYSKDKLVNNIYKDTDNYSASNKRAVDPRYWVHQIGMVFKHYPNVQFRIYQEPDWELPQAWNYSNVTVDKISSLV
jgi:hypothetical protein